jgi:hypothetical protein
MVAKALTEDRSQLIQMVLRFTIADPLGHKSEEVAFCERVAELKELTAITLPE